jgi:hypothetical protein
LGSRRLIFYQTKIHSPHPIDARRIPAGSLRLFAGMLDLGLASYLSFASVVSLRSALLSKIFKTVSDEPYSPHASLLLSHRLPSHTLGCAPRR